ncbi:MAG: hypothetical protein FJX34_04280 [Alphaproteobacteria bacterium]|nr:hypothetical protein [Alphaproteobacteria bacterium]
MSNKSKFLKSAKLAIAAAVVTSGLSSCEMMSGKHACMSKKSDTKEEKMSCATGKDGKMKCSTTKEGKMSCSSKKK